MQSKTISFIEVCLSTFIGAVVALATQLAIFPLFGIHIPIQDNLWIAAIFTVVSIIRSYFVRRLFNWFEKKALD